MLLTTCTAGNP